MPKLGYSQRDVEEIAEYLFDKDTVLSKEYVEHKKRGMAITRLCLVS
jgi:hypothetical protein